ncbi:nuclear transport factor 2 family protein [Actinoplanes sp. NPDC051343]|uniref:nuclear transport factor 2 family protein n=1 Tax=Actinoplanes sp. NPDC051343 TaxID=3363906 RepID=UPI00379C0EE8
MKHTPLDLPDPIIERELSALVQRERLARDTGDFETMENLYWPDSVVRVTWFTGSIAEFAKVSRERQRTRGGGFHVIIPVRSEVEGDRALVESLGEIHIRPHVEGVECDVVAWGRFFSRVERRDGQWRLRTFDSIYKKDRIDPVSPDAVLQLDPERLAAARPSYRHLTYLNRDAAYPVPDDLPGDDEPALVEDFYREARTWLHGKNDD